MELTEELKNQFANAKVEKVIRYFRGRKVELPVKEKKLKNKVVSNPTQSDTTDMFGGTYTPDNWNS